MLPISRKISRLEFPTFNTPAFNWQGEVLRIINVKQKKDIAKFAIICSKKTYDTKIQRNRFKRRVFFEISQHLHKLDTNPHGYFIIFPVIHTKNISFSLIKKDIENYIAFTSK